jgi:hypothetical protein
MHENVKTIAPPPDSGPNDPNVTSRVSAVFAGSLSTSLRRSVRLAAGRSLEGANIVKADVLARLAPSADAIVRLGFALGRDKCSFIERNIGRAVSSRAAIPGLGNCSVFGRSDCQRASRASQTKKVPFPSQRPSHRRLGN